MYLVSDDYGDFKEIMNYKQLKEFLVNEITFDTIENHKDYDIVAYNVGLLSDIAKEIVNYNKVIEELKSHGWYVINILDIQKDVSALREYVAGKNTNLKVFDDLLEYIDKELK